MRVASWNVNSVRARLPRLLAFLKRHKPDILCLQETKVTDQDFPMMEIESAGYRVLHYGQKSYNGVAILLDDPSKRSNLEAFGTNGGVSTKKGLGKPKGVQRGFPDNPVPEQSRVISACICGLRIVNVYVVNGSAMDSPDFELKRQWMNALGKWQHSLPSEPPLLVVGDFNVAPDDRDVWDPEGLSDRIHCTDEERSWLQQLMGNRFYDLLRENHDKSDVYTWWPYQDDAFERGEGLRFDLALGDWPVVDKVEQVWVDIEERRPSFGSGSPSDHAPVIVDFEDIEFSNFSKTTHQNPSKIQYWLNLEKEHN